MTENNLDDGLRLIRKWTNKIQRAATNTTSDLDNFLTYPVNLFKERVEPIVGTIDQEHLIKFTEFKELERLRDNVAEAVTAIHLNSSSSSGAGWITQGLSNPPIWWDGTGEDPPAYR